MDFVLAQAMERSAVAVKESVECTVCIGFVAAPHEEYADKGLEMVVLGCREVADVVGWGRRMGSKQMASTHSAQIWLAVNRAGIVAGVDL